ncbi:VOC family protein [Oerskovia sp. Sa1BUA8]|uniref:VOC family protein n=1 Tax=Oerskovia douganii TaxID=2762210 RepID=A0A9D5UD08_9CELL|nr:VOC family protein [Oerskovia douganii]MBE7700791.1 VOC family protein [Oerskovia douganii]
MEARVSLITLGVRDVSRARAFYVEGLGWEPVEEVPGEVVFLQVGHGLLLSLWRRADLLEEAGPGIHEGHHGTERMAPVALAHNVGSPAEVDDVLASATAAGGSVVVRAQVRVWGGYSGYFADPDGFRWEVAHNPGLVVSDDGRVAFVAPGPDPGAW